jgi:hypothetical protein
MKLIRKLVVFQPPSRKVLQRLTSVLGINAISFSQYRSFPVRINFMKFTLLKHRFQFLPAQMRTLTPDRPQDTLTVMRESRLMVL